jgi:hypothetical protein
VSTQSCNPPDLVAGLLLFAPIAIAFEARVTDTMVGFTYADMVNLLLWLEVDGFRVGKQARRDGCSQIRGKNRLQRLHTSA